MNLLGKFLERTEFSDYNDFYCNFKYKDIRSFNFGFDVVDEYAKLCPEKRALVWCNNKGDEKIFTFGELSKLSNKAANMLARNGIGKGDVVMSMLNRRYEYYILVIACCKLGAIIVPATYLLTTKDISYRCNTAKVKAIVSISEDEVVEHISETLLSCPTVKCVFTVQKHDNFKSFMEEIEKESDVYVNPALPSLDETMLVYFTSGTTGQPKMVAHNFKYPLGHIINAHFWQTVSDDGVHFTMAETGWAKFSWGKIYGQWIAGSAVFCYDYFGRFTPTEVLPLIEKYQITTFCAPPTIYRFLIKEDMTKYNFSSLKSCSTAGEPLNGEVYRQFKKVTGLKIREGFGQSETSALMATFKYIDCRPGSMGMCSPNYDIKLLSGDKEVGDGEEGEVCVKLKENQFGLLMGYYLDNEKTANIYATGYYRTGDLAYRDASGYYWFIGRKDDIIKSSGYRIGPFEVESALMEHPAVMECAITAVPDPLRGQIVKATIVLAKGYTASNELVTELQTFTKKLTAPYKYPRIIEFVTTLPKTYSGKIKHKDIRNNDAEK